jgi:hypothetical protein
MSSRQPDTILPLFCHSWDAQQSNDLFYKDFFSSAIVGEQNLKANVHKGFHLPSSQCDRRWLYHFV